MAGNYAGFVSYTDHQIGRLLDYLEESGQLDDTIIVVVSDNGASGEGGPNGSFNENKFFNNVPDTVEAEGVLFAHGGVGGGHSLFIRDGRLHYVYNWLGERLQTVTSEETVPTGRHVLTAEFAKTGEDPQTHSAVGTLTLYVDTAQVGQAEITTQPGMFSLTGDGLSVGRDSGSAVSPDYTPPFPFTGGTLERVAIDVSGDHFVDHEKEVLAYLTRD